MNENDRRIFGVFIAMVAIAAFAIMLVAVSIGDAPLAIIMFFATCTATFIVADAFRYHGKHEEGFR